MRYLILALCLLCSFSVFAETAQNWNKRFYELNPKAGQWNAKWDQPGQQKYLKLLLTNSAPNQFFNPDDYRLPIAPIPAAPYIPPAVVQGDTIKDLLKRIKADVESLDKQFQ